MLRLLILVWSAGVLLTLAPGHTRAQEVVDRIAARVDDDVVLLSEVRDLSRYQQLVNGRSESDEQILDRLIDQWIVRNEAQIAQFPYPSKADIDKGMERLKKSFASPGEFEARRKQSELTDDQVRNLVGSQLYLSNYLESRFRPSVQVSEKEVEDFYQSALIPRAKARGQDAPSLDAARDTIQEALVQRAIDEQADVWIKESRSRLHVDKLLKEGTQ